MDLNLILRFSHVYRLILPEYVISDWVPHSPPNFIISATVRPVVGHLHLWGPDLPSGPHYTVLTPNTGVVAPIGNIGWYLHMLQVSRPIF